MTPSTNIGPLRTAAMACALVAAAATTGCYERAAEARDLDAACSGGDATACNELGERMRAGSGVLADWRRASDLFGQACEGGEGEGCVRLARLHVHSRGERRGVPADSALATTLFERGCDAGAMVGCTDLADMILATDSLAAAEAADEATSDLDRGTVTAADTASALDSTTAGASGETPGARSPVATRAATLYRRACDGEEMTACTRLGLLYGRGRGVERDPTLAAELHDRACEGGSQLGCTHLGLAYAEGVGVEANPERAASLFETACETEMAGCHHLADLYTRGVGVAQDWERAEELFDDACYGVIRDDERLPPFAASCFRLGDMAANGTGVERDLYDAARYFRRACNLGIDEACRRS